MTKIVTNYNYPPIPIRTMDWCAFYEGEEEKGGYGYGSTELEAIKDLIDNNDSGANEMWHIRQDTYKVGDNVHFQCKNELETNIAACHEMLYGLGPYEVTAIKLAQYPQFAGHTQHLTINGEGYSGMFFEPKGV